MLNIVSIPQPAITMRIFWLARSWPPARPVFHQEERPANERRKRIQFSNPKNASAAAAKYLFGCILPSGLIAASVSREIGNVLYLIRHGEDKRGDDEHGQGHRKNQAVGPAARTDGAKHVPGSEHGNQPVEQGDQIEQP